MYVKARPLVVCAAALLLAGCGGSGLDSRLTRYHKGEVSLGYPKAWRPPPAANRVVPGANFEVASTSPGNGNEAALDVFTSAPGAAPLDRDVFDFVQISRTQPNFRLLGQRKTTISGRPAYEVTKEYGVPQAGGAPLMIRATDWLTLSSKGSRIDIRVGFVATKYDTSLIKAIKTSITIS